MTTNLENLNHDISIAYALASGLNIPPGPLASATGTAIESLAYAADLIKELAQLDAKVCVFCGRLTTEQMVESMFGPEATAHASCNALDQQMADHIADQGGRQLPKWVYEFVSSRAA